MIAKILHDLIVSLMELLTAPEVDGEALRQAVLVRLDVARALLDGLDERQARRWASLR